LSAELRFAFLDTLSLSFLLARSSLLQEGLSPNASSSSFPPVEISSIFTPFKHYFQHSQPKLTTLEKMHLF
jgi:hypothetical protein